MLWRGIWSMVVFLVALGALLFLSAGSVRWVQGWILLLVFVVWTVPGIAYLWYANPEIFVARRGFRRDMKGWDKIVVAFLLASYMAMFLVGALDAGRFHGSRVPIWLMVVGYLLFSAGFLISMWVEKVNRFAEPGVRIQTERGHEVIDKGPYAIVRHPMYSSAMLFFAAIPLCLGSFWALVPAALGAASLVVRTVLEDRTLQRELTGYRDYTRRVRHRLIPGIW
jgi:protein-S-isoprenylcysteine O-methyltransferase Ste14